MIKPQFKHDCDKCVFLGRDSGYDVYWCPTEMNSVSNGGSVVARFGIDGNYASGPVKQYLSTEIPEAKYVPQGDIQLEIEAEYRDVLIRAAKKLLRENRIGILTLNPLLVKT